MHEQAAESDINCVNMWMTMVPENQIQQPPAQRRRRGVLAAVLFCLCAAINAGGQPLPDYGYQWSTIGAPGNRPANAQEGQRYYAGIPGFAPPPGRVDYEYRLARTEVTTAEWFEFVVAYAPYYTGSLQDADFTSLYIQGQPGGAGQPPTFSYPAAIGGVAANVGWEWAARYCNWLHNGKALTRDAFESGAYDTSTFTVNADGSRNDQEDRSPGARFWLPSRDEWVKGMYYDPHRYGDGLEGYWYYPTGSDTPPLPGFPGTGGQTSGDVPGFDAQLIPVGSYPEVQSPWGLLDGSGSASEWLENTVSNRRSRGRRGSNAGNAVDILDPLDAEFSTATFANHGIRIASVVPSVGGIAVIVLGLASTLSRRRR